MRKRRLSPDYLKQSKSFKHDESITTEYKKHLEFPEDNPDEDEKIDEKENSIDVDMENTLDDTNGDSEDREEIENSINTEHEIVTDDTNTEHDDSEKDDVSKDEPNVLDTVETTTTKPDDTKPVDKSEEAENEMK